MVKHICETLKFIPLSWGVTVNKIYYYSLGFAVIYDIYLLS